MKTNTLFTAFIVTAMLAGSNAAFATGIYDGFKSIYVCGPEANEDLLNGVEWEAAIGYYTATKTEIKFAAGWPAFPQKGTVLKNTKEAFQIEGYAGMDTFVNILIDRSTTLTQIGSKKYPVSKATYRTNVQGLDTTDTLDCIYFPKNDTLLKN